MHTKTLPRYGGAAALLFALLAVALTGCERDAVAPAHDVEAVRRLGNGVGNSPGSVVTQAGYIGSGFKTDTATVRDPVPGASAP